MQTTPIPANNQRNLKAFAAAPLNSPQEQLANWSGNTHLPPATNGSRGRLPTDNVFNACVKMVLEMRICPPWRLSHGEKSQRKSLRRASDHATDSTSCSFCAVMIQNFLVIQVSAPHNKIFNQSLTFKIIQDKINLNYYYFPSGCLSPTCKNQSPRGSE